jgi:hypothetical protein
VVQHVTVLFCSSGRTIDTDAVNDVKHDASRHDSMCVVGDTCQYQIYFRVKYLTVKSN